MWAALVLIVEKDSSFPQARSRGGGAWQAPHERSVPLRGHPPPLPIHSQQHRTSKRAGHDAGLLMTWP